MLREFLANKKRTKAIFCIRIEAVSRLPRRLADQQTMKLRSTIPPPTCQLAIPASAGANSPYLHRHPVIWIVQLAEQEESCFLLEAEKSSNA
jgi:hypothetical protein